MYDKKAEDKITPVLTGTYDDDDDDDENSESYLE